VPGEVHRYADIDPAAWATVLDQLRDGLRPCTSLEQVASTTAGHLYETFAETTVLARVYALLPFRDLPPDVAAFVEKLVPADASGPGHTPETPVLTLMGTRGARAEWCDRRKSVGHKGIPLLSASFVERIPMLARLLKELGIDLAWLDEAPEVNARRLVGGFNGVFYVSDATTSRDAQGRQIIPAQDFVASEGVKSVIGMGGFYPDGMLVVAIAFTREEVSRPQADRLKSLVSTLKGETFGVVRARRLFSAPQVPEAP